MGICGSSDPNAIRSKEIEKSNREHQKAEERKIKLLLLGAGESGKSTVFKQMKIMYGQQEEDPMESRSIVYSNILTSLKTLIKEAEATTHTDHLIECKAVADNIVKAEDSEPLSGSLGADCVALWADPGIQATWEQRHLFQIVESVKTYFDDLPRITQDDYRPTQQDILLARVRTSGIVEETYLIDTVPFVLFDVGGQRNERKKWIHCFEGVTSVIFVAAISEYNQMLYEDATTNRMDEALELFKEIVNSKWFTKSAMILFLNKRDLLDEKVLQFPIHGSMGKYLDFPIPGPCTEANHDEYKQTAYTYWTNSFLQLNNNPDKTITHHVTCATDTENIKAVFETCKQVILKGNLESSGFMD